LILKKGKELISHLLLNEEEEKKIQKRYKISKISKKSLIMGKSWCK
jgi:DNA-directed RNA polymerase subunit H (RpoH/RPB5)